MTLQNTLNRQPMSDALLRRKFQQFGDVKSVGSREDSQMKLVLCCPYLTIELSDSYLDSQKYVEMYDSRASCHSNIVLFILMTCLVGM